MGNDSHCLIEQATQDGLRTQARHQIEREQRDCYQAVLNRSQEWVMGGTFKWAGSEFKYSTDLEDTLSIKRDGNWVVIENGLTEKLCADFVFEYCRKWGIDER